MSENEIHEDLVEGNLSINGRKILEYIARHRRNFRSALQTEAAQELAEPYRWVMTQARKELDIDREPLEYLGYAIQEIIDQA